jgi:hypothetical protein
MPKSAAWFMLAPLHRDGFSMSSPLPNATAEASLMQRLPRWLLPFGFWSLLGLSSSVSSMLNAINEGEARTWRRTFAYNLPQFYLWMLLTPLVARLGRYTAQCSWQRFFAVHVPASLLMALVQSSGTLVLYWLLRGDVGSAPTTIADVFRVEIVYQFHQSLVIYWVVLTVLRGTESRRSLRDERLRTARLENQLAQSQLQVLRTQLQPHFLFNTLNAISALALSDPPLARTMVARLSDFLRLTLEEGQRQRVPLARELEFLDCYLAIQRVRFQDRLTTELDIPDDTLEAIVPHLILQPLVENALQHGLLPMPGGGLLRVAAKRVGNVLHLVVEDDGKGFTADALREGIGLGNTRARLEALGVDGIDLRARNGGGTRVELRLPFETAP